MKRVLALFLLMSLLVAACGGDGGTDEDPEEPGTTQAESNDDDSDDSPPTTSDVNDDEDDSGDEGEGPSTATVTLGDETYEFSSEGAMVAQCLPDLFGIFVIQVPMADGGDGSISLQILREGTDPSVVEQNNAIEVSIGDVDWIADPENFNILDNPDVPAGQSEVLTAEVDGRTVRGTANFAGSQTVFAADFV